MTISRKRNYLLTASLLMQFSFAGNFDQNDGTANLGTVALTVSGSALSGYYNGDSGQTLTFTFTPSVDALGDGGNGGIVKKISILYHIGTSDPALNQANFAMKNGRTTIDVDTYEGFPANDRAGYSQIWVNSSGWANGVAQTITITDDQLESAFTQNAISGTTSESDRNGKRIYFAALYFIDDGAGWELDQITTSSDVAGSGNWFYLTFDEIDPTLGTITDGDDQSLNSTSWTTTLNSNYTKSNITKTTVGAEDITSLKIQWIKEAGDGGVINSGNYLTVANATNASQAITYTQSNLVNNTRYDIYYQIADAAGNTTTYGDYNIWYDTSAPTVTGVHSLETNGATLKKDEVASFYVQFSEAMDFPSATAANNTITIKINSGGGDTRTIGAASDKDGGGLADGDETMRFNYTVQANDYSKYFEYATAGALGGGTYQDRAGNDLADCTSCGGTLPPPPNFGSQASGSNVADFSLSNASTGGSFSIDGDPPTGFSIASVTPVGGNVVTNYINGVNTGIRIAVNLPTADETIVDGKLLIEGNYNNQGWGSISTPATGWIITSAERNAGEKTDADVSVSGGANDLDDLTSWATGNSVQFRVTVTDKNDNAGSAATYGTASAVDLFKPIVKSVTGAAANIIARTLKVGATEVFEVNIVDGSTNAAETVTYVDGGNEPTLKLETGATDAAPEMTVPANNASATKLKFSYTVSSGETSVANADEELITHATSPLSVGGGTIRDAAGNDINVDISGLSVANSLKNANITVDGVSPAKIVLDSIIVAGTGAEDTTVQGYWNQYSDKLTFYMPIPAAGTDPTLTGGNIQLQVDFDGAFTNLGSATAIGSGDQGNTKFPIEVNAATFEGTNGWTNGDEAKFKAIVTDVSGNSTPGDQAITKITIDETSPSDPTVDDTTTVGAPVVDGYWNASNTNIQVTVNVPNEADLVGGKFQIQAKISDSGVANWADIGTPKTSLTTYNDKQTITVTKASLAGHAGYADAATITYRAIIWDKAGNKKIGSDYAGTQLIDITAPTVSKVFANTPASILKASDSHNITVRLTENPTVSVVAPKLDLDTDNSPGTTNGSASYASKSNADMVFSYTVGTTEYAVDPNYLDVNGNSPLTVTNAYIRDVAGNDANLDFAGVTGANALPTSKVEVDGIAPDLKQTGTVVASGSGVTIRSGYFNSTNDSVSVTVPLSDTDVSIIGGKVEVYVKLTTDVTWVKTGADQSISAADKNAASKTVYVNKSQLNTANNFITNNEGKTLEFTVKVYDSPGNSTQYTKSDSKIIIDTTAPTDKKMADIVTLGGNVVDNYWNSTNTATNIIVNLDNTDASLANGEVVLQGTNNNGTNWADLRQIVGGAESDTATIVTLASTITLAVEFSYNTAGKYGIETFPTSYNSTLADGNTLYFRATVLDAAGNKTLWSKSDSLLVVKQTLPTVSMVTSSVTNRAYKAGTKLRLLVVSKSNNSLGVTEKLYVTGTPTLELETGAPDAVVSYVARSASDDSIAFDYTIESPHTSSDLNYKNATTSLSIGTGVSVLDAYGNPLNSALPALGNANSLAGKKDIEIDTTPPSVLFTYDDPDSLVRFEDGTLVITATFSDSIQIDSIPRITVDFPANTAGDKSNINMTRTSGKIYKYSLPLVDNSDGLIAVSLSAVDKALNPLVADSIFADTIITIDNTDPAAFIVGKVTAEGDTVVAPVDKKASYGDSLNWINNKTDSLNIKVPISGTDESLLRGGDVDIEMRVIGKMTADTWARIPTSDATSKSFPLDSIKQLSGDQSFFRKKSDITSTLTPKGLVQGDTILIRAIINDRVGNKTTGTLSKDYFVLDTIPPAKRPFIRDTLFTTNNVTQILTVNRDTLWTNDTIRFAFNNWVDSVKTGQTASGLNRFEYALYQSTKKTPDNANPADWTKFRDYRTAGNISGTLLETSRTDTFALTHERKYYVALKSIDIAGNTSDTLNSFRTFRHNARPIVDTIPDVTANEDVLWEQILEVNDKDILIKDGSGNVIGGTLRDDVFTYALTVMKLDTTQTPIDSVVVDPANIAALVTANGKVSFTPTKLDTAAFVFRVIVTDNWTLKDTVDIDITVLPVNDPPILDLSSIAKMIFLEGANSDSINLTRYAYDEDNDTTDLKFSFRITSTLPGKGGYPIAKIGFLSNFNDGYKQSFISKLVDEFPSSTIVQKNDAFLIYPASANQFRDPIKVDSLVQGDSTFAWLMPTDTASSDTNYFTSSDMLVEFTVTDPSDSVGKDTVTFFINPLNDPPVWTSLPDTTIKENDSLYFDFADYLSDVDDSTLTISILPLTFGDNITIEPTPKYNIKPSGIEYLTTAHKDTVKLKPEALWFGPNGPWVKNKTDSTLIQITAADDDTSSIDTFIVYVQRVPRPEIRMYVVQNNAFTNYYEIFLVDSVGKTKDLTLKIQSKAVTLDTAAAFTYVGHYNFKTKGTYTFEVDATGVVGDTSVTKNLGLALAKMYATWSGRSADGQFQVIGKNGVVDFDQSVMILDSTLFEPHFNDRASYLLGNEAFRFKKSVEISMPGENEEIAIYQRSTGTGWIELPSITQGNRVMAYTEKMGYFRMGPKTLLVPGQTALQQNYPNPFNPVTTIEYDLGFVDGPYQKVSMTIYDILGRNVKTLVNEQKSIGRYRLKWNGKDQNGVNVSSGIYFVHLLTDMGRSQTKKIMLVR